QMRDFVVALREKVKVQVPMVKTLRAPVADGSQTVCLWKDREDAKVRRAYGGASRLKPADLPSGTAGAAMAFPDTPEGWERYDAAFTRFCSVFPDDFYIAERARAYADPEREKAARRTGRLLSAGFHSQMGYFRDDQPLYNLLLDEAGQKELDELWLELDFIADACRRQHRQFLWFERTDSSFIRDEQFDAYKPEDKDSTSEEKIRGLATVYLEKVRRAYETRGETPDPEVIKAVEDYFAITNANIRHIE